MGGVTDGSIVVCFMELMCGEDCGAAVGDVRRPPVHYRGDEEAAASEAGQTS